MLLRDECLIRGMADSLVKRLRRKDTVFYLVPRASEQWGSRQAEESRFRVTYRLAAKLMLGGSEVATMKDLLAGEPTVATLGRNAGSDAMSRRMSEDVDVVRF